MIYIRILVLLLLLVLSLAIPSGSEITKDNLMQDQIDFLMERLSSNFWSKDQKYRKFIQWQHKQGLYKSSVHFNIVDKRNSKLASWMRKNLIDIDDENMFVTSFVLYGLLQAQELNKISINEKMFSQSLMAMYEFRDQNKPYGFPQYVFWEQQKSNSSWVAFPYNLFKFVEMAPEFPKFIQTFLYMIGLGPVAIGKGYLNVFKIPPDNDDSSVNLALLGLMKETNSSHFEFWNSLNFKKQEFYENSLKYAYRPFEANYSQNPRANEIDPRTYYAIHKFIELRKQQAEEKGQQPSLVLPTTWLMSFDQQVENQTSIPLHVNNVDASVTANFLFGLSYQALTGQVQMTAELKQIAVDCADLLDYLLKGPINERPDLLLLYYPSKFDFYWFVSRSINLLRRQESLASPFTEIYKKLSSVMQSVGTSDILKQRKSNNKFKYWAEFLGNYAGKQRDNDALFATSLAINALLDTWTYRKGSVIRYIEQTPQEVQQAIQEGVQYLESTISEKMKEENAFFSGSLKDFHETLLYFYPANIHRDINGTNINPHTDNISDLSNCTEYSVQGIIEPAEYEKMLNESWWGVPVPKNFSGFNHGFGLTFPYWSSEPITEIMMITSLSKFLSLESKQ